MHHMNKAKKVLRCIKSWMKYNPPGSMTSKGWRLFENEYKEKAPVRFWIMNSFKFRWIMPIKWKYDRVTDWIRYRTYDQYHKIDTGLKPGYYDVDTLMLHVNFNMLKDFVEVEQAWSRYIWSDERKENASWCEKHMPFYRRFYKFRRPDLGIKHLEWAATLDDPKLPPHERCDHQAVHARETMALYKWWVEERSARKEIEYPEYDKQGLGTMGSLDDDFDRGADDYKVYVSAIDAGSKQKEDWDNEDEEMLIRLMKIRRGLWT